MNRYTRLIFTLFLLALPLLLVGAPAPPAVAGDMSGDPAGDATGPTAVATFAGGCFWCMEGPFDVLNGVISTTAGYIGGHTKNPTYQQVSAGGTGHAEAVQVRYDPREITYGELLEVYWRNVDPVTLNRQFCDGGTQYRSAIFFHTPEQEAAARASRDALDASGRFDRPVVTEVAPATVFYPAEDYHQDFYVHNPIRYKFYRYNCGRDRRLEELWGEESHHG